MSELDEFTQRRIGVELEGGRFIKLLGERYGFDHNAVGCEFLQEIQKQMVDEAKQLQAIIDLVQRRRNAKDD